MALKFLWVPRNWGLSYVHYPAGWVEHDPLKQRAAFGLHIGPVAVVWSGGM